MSVIIANHYGYHHVSFILLKLRQQRFQPQRQILVRLLKIARVPRIRNVSRFAAKLQQTVHLPRRITAADACHIAHIRSIHSDQPVTVVIICSRQLSRPMLTDRHTLFAQLRLRRRIHPIADLFPRRRRRIHSNIINTPHPQHLPKHTLSHRRPANIAVAYK